MKKVSFRVIAYAKRKLHIEFSFQKHVSQKNLIFTVQNRRDRAVTRYRKIGLIFVIEDQNYLYPYIKDILKHRKAGHFSLENIVNYTSKLNHSNIFP